MTKANESFSAFLDGEASELDIQRLLKAMDDNPQVTGQWHQLSRVKASLQGDPLVDTAVHAEIAPADPVESRTQFSGYRRLIQGGIAAAVAVLTVTVVGLGTLESPQPEVATLTVEQGPETVTEQLQLHYAAQQRLQTYLKNHAEQASFTTGHVVVPAEVHWVEGEH